MNKKPSLTPAKKILLLLLLSFGLLPSIAYANVDYRLQGPLGYFVSAYNYNGYSYNVPFRSSELSRLKVGQRISKSVNMRMSANDDTPGNQHGGPFSCSGSSRRSTNFTISFSCSGGYLGGGNASTTVYITATATRTNDSYSQSSVSWPSLYIDYRQNYGGGGRWTLNNNRSTTIPPQTRPACSGLIKQNGKAVNSIGLDTVRIWKTQGPPPNYTGKLFTINPSNETGCDIKYYKYATISLASPTTTTGGVPSIVSSKAAYGFTIQQTSNNKFWQTGSRVTVGFKKAALIEFRVNYFKLKANSSSSGNITAPAIFNLTFN